MIRLKRLLLAFLVFVALAFAFLVWAGNGLRTFAESPMASPETVVPEAILWVAPGDTPARVMQQLEDLGLTRSDWRWEWLVRLERPVIRAGEYRVSGRQTPRQLLDQLRQGDVVKHRFTIIEGWTLERLRISLAADSRLQQRTVDLEAGSLMQSLGCEDCFAEGWFLPETYLFQRGDSDLDLLMRAHQAMREALDQHWQQRSGDVQLDRPEELLVLASLVEQETTLAEEAPRVAGVFIRRLQRGMRLQTDPTVAYGVELPPDGRLRRVHLESDHPWNTYTRHGLPPTPIALPGRIALDAAARPEIGDALYFVARGDGSHQFSATLAEHNRAVRRYILGRP